MEKIKITKQELKKNDLLEALSKIKNYFISNKQRIKPYIIGACVIIVVAVLLTTAIRKKKNEANEIYTGALYKYASNMFEADANYDQIIAEFEKAYNTYSKSKLSKLTLLNIADAYYRKNDYQNALNYYDRFLAASSDPIFKSFGTYGKALSLAQLRKSDEALQLFESLLTNESADFIKADVLIQCAIILSNRNEIDKALSYLQRISTDANYKDTSWKSYADYLSAYLKQKKYLPAVEYKYSRPDKTKTDMEAANLQNSVFNAANAERQSQKQLEQLNGQQQQRQQTTNSQAQMQPNQRSAVKQQPPATTAVKQQSQPLKLEQQSGSVSGQNSAGINSSAPANQKPPVATPEKTPAASK